MLWLPLWGEDKVEQKKSYASSVRMSLCGAVAVKSKVLDASLHRSNGLLFALFGCECGGDIIPFFWVSGRDTLIWVVASLPKHERRNHGVGLQCVCFGEEGVWTSTSRVSRGTGPKTCCISRKFTTPKMHFLRLCWAEMS